jgi:glucose/arabinose dehydrogenase
MKFIHAAASFRFLSMPPERLALVVGALLCCASNLRAQVGAAVAHEAVSQTNLAGSNITMVAGAGGSAPLSYQWSSSDAILANGATNAKNGNPTLPHVKLERVFAASRIDRPLWMEEAPDGSGRIFIAEQCGVILMLQKGSDGSKAKEVLRIGGGDLYDEQANEKGLLGFAFHPKFKQNGKFYVYYTHVLDDGSITTVTSEFKMSAKDPDMADPASERKLLVIQRPWWNHEGGCLAFGPDSYLYISSGDGGHQRDPYNNGQNLSVLLAKMLRIDVDHPDAGKNYGIQRTILS